MRLRDLIRTSGETPIARSYRKSPRRGRRREGLAPFLDLEETLRSYMRRRLAQHLEDSYMGRPMIKFPEDLCAYERFMWQMRANSVIELGVAHGGSTLWLRDRLQALGGGLIVAVDIGRNPNLPDDIRFVQADILDPQLPDVVESLLPEGARPFIIEDTAHTYETTTAALEGFHRLIPPRGVPHHRRRGGRCR